MTLWMVLGVFALVAAGFAVWPLYRGSGRLSALLAVVIVFVVALSASMYHFRGNPNVLSGAGSMPGVDEIVTSLEERLVGTPDDIDGWRMLGRSYQTMKRYDESIAAFEKAMALEKGQNADTLIALAVVLMEQQGGPMTERAGGLFENSLALAPNNSNALFYGGVAAAGRGNTALAADRWETLLNQDAPPEVRNLLQAKISEWRGLPAPSAAAPSAEVSGPMITLSISLSDEARADLPSDATVYVIARDPAQPSPPIAVTPRRLSELPATVTLSDRNSMVPGRPLSGFQDLEIVVRVSLSGTPMAQSGDWSGTLRTSADESAPVNLVIDSKVP